MVQSARSVRFPFAFAPRYRAAARPFGITPDRTWVEVTDSELDARYGPWRLHTPLANIAWLQVTGPYHFIKTAGPARLGITDRGLTFASNGRLGLLITFFEKVPAIDPARLVRHPELTVTVAEPEALATMLHERSGAELRARG